MAAEQLSIQLTADITNFRANLANAAAELNRTGNQAQAASNQISSNIARVNAINLSGFNRSLQQGAIALSSIATVSTSASRGLAQVAAASATTGRTVAAGSNQATMALTNLGRVAQDSSFGFIGIANNLNPLLESFQRLRAESGSNVTALRALGSSLMGAGGVGLALSIVQAAVLFSQMGLRAWTGTVKKATEQTKDYIEGLDAISNANLKGAQNSQKELTELRSLYSVATDTTVALVKRKEAVDELQDKYPKYLGNIKDEAILNGEAEKSYDSLTKSITATARARAAEDLIAKKASALLLNEEQIRNAEAGLAQNKKSEAFRIAVNKKAIEDAKKLDDAKSAGLQTTAAETNLIALNDKFAKANANQQDYINIRKKANLKITQDIANLEKFTTDQVKKGADLTSGGDSKGEKSVKSLADILKELGENLEKTEVQLNSTFGERNEAQIKAYQTAIDSATDSFGKQSKAVQDLIAAQRRLFQLPSIADGSTNVGGLAPKNTSKVNTKREDTSFGANLSKASNELTVRYAEILAKQNKFNEDFKKGFENLTTGAVVDAIGSGFSAIGEAMVGGGNIIEAAGQALLGTLGSFLNELGSMLIKKGLATVLAGTALNFLFPGSGAKTTAGGFALIAAGAALSLGSGVVSGMSSSGTSTKEAKSNVTAFAEGGIISGPTLGLMGEYSGAKSNPEVVAPLNKLKSMLGDRSPQFEVIQYIEGDKLAVLVRNSNKRLNRI